MRSAFHGRTEELAILRALFEQCAGKGPEGEFAGPRMAIIVADSGIGKSRLVQELYNQLTADPKWDPPESNYWPDSFRDRGNELRTNPDMSGHLPAGPPRFMWLGARWRPPVERNAVADRSLIAELDAGLDIHAKVIDTHRPILEAVWRRARSIARKDGAGECANQAADLVVPFGGLVLRAIREVASLAWARSRHSMNPTAIVNDQSARRVDALVQRLHHVLAGCDGLPTILWLDDVQWIDKETMSCLRQLWDSARGGRWPLLVVATHWEREWRQLKKSTRAADGSLAEWCGVEGVTTIALGPATVNEMAACLADQLPGLLPSQRDLLLEKASGNHLAMVENLGFLLLRPANFVEGRVDGPLSDVGVLHVRQWESDRTKRVEQRFAELAPEIQNVLGWGSAQGISFIQEVVERFSLEMTGSQSCGPVLADCVDPLAILGRPSALRWEFRDKMFHAAATRYLSVYGTEHQERLNSVLRGYLAEWVDNCFTPDGDARFENSEAGIPPPVRSTLALSKEDAGAILDLAVREFPLPRHPAWSSVGHRVAVRARVLFLRHSVDRESGAPEDCCLWVDRVDWSQVPPDVVSVPSRQFLCVLVEASGYCELALGLSQDVVLRSRRQAESDPTDANVESLILSLEDCARGHEMIDWDVVRDCTQEAIETTRSRALESSESRWARRLIAVLTDAMDSEVGLNTECPSREWLRELDQLSRTELEGDPSIECQRLRRNALNAVYLGMRNYVDVDWEDYRAQYLSSVSPQSDSTDRRRVLSGAMSAYFLRISDESRRRLRELIELAKRVDRLTGDLCDRVHLHRIYSFEFAERLKSEPEAARKARSEFDAEFPLRTLGEPSSVVTAPCKSASIADWTSRTAVPRELRVALLGYWRTLPAVDGQEWDRAAARGACLGAKRALQRFNRAVDQAKERACARGLGEDLLEFKIALGLVPASASAAVGIGELNPDGRRRCRALVSADDPIPLEPWRFAGTAGDRQVTVDAWHRFTGARARLAEFLVCHLERPSVAGDAEATTAEGMDRCARSSLEAEWAELEQSIADYGAAIGSLKRENVSRTQGEAVSALLKWLEQDIGLVSGFWSSTAWSSPHNRAVLAGDLCTLAEDVSDAVRGPLGCDAATEQDDALRKASDLLTGVAVRLEKFGDQDLAERVWTCSEEFLELAGDVTPEEREELRD